MNSSNNQNIEQNYYINDKNALQLHISELISRIDHLEKRGQFDEAHKYIKNVSYIIAEVQDVQRNENTPLRKDINDFLKQYNFKEMYTTCNLEKGQIFGDSIYVKQ